jgi:excinuclease ABC subunit A
MLLSVLHRLVEKGNTVLIIEHQLDVIASADHVVDIGPEGGGAGGHIVAQGTPEKLAKHGGHTGRCLLFHLERAAALQ